MVIHNLWSLLGLCCWLYPQICSLSTSPHLLLPSVPSSNVYLVTSLLEPGWSVAAVGSAQTKPVTRPQSGSCAMSWQQFRVCTLHKTRPCARLVPSPCTPGSLLVDLRVECQPGEGDAGRIMLNGSDTRNSSLRNFLLHRLRSTIELACSLRGRCIWRHGGAIV